MDEEDLAALAIEFLDHDSPNLNAGWRRVILKLIVDLVGLLKVGGVVLARDREEGRRVENLQVLALLVLAIVCCAAATARLELRSSDLTSLVWGTNGAWLGVLRSGTQGRLRTRVGDDALGEAAANRGLCRKWISWMFHIAMAVEGNLPVDLRVRQTARLQTSRCTLPEAQKESRHQEQTAAAGPTEGRAEKGSQ